MQLLARAGWPRADVVSVDRDSILFLSGAAPDQRPHTAWLHRFADGGLRIDIVDGFDGVEPGDLHRGGATRVRF
jgi:hypothetical protein